MNEKIITMVESKTTTKRTLADFLKDNLKKVTDKNLADRISYCLGVFKKSVSKVTKEDLVDLCKEVGEFLDSQTTVAVEASPKLSKKSGSKPAPKKKVEEPDDEDEEDETPKKSTKGSAKKNVIKSTKGSISSKLPPVAQAFPDVYEHKDLGTLIACKGEFTTYKEVYEALEEGATLYFACYWTPRHIKEFSYAVSRQVTAPKSFPDDLDILLAVVPCETMERLYCMSQYTEALFMFEGDDFSYVTDKTEDGEEFEIRVSAGMEFEIYRPENEQED